MWHPCPQPAAPIATLEVELKAAGYFGRVPASGLCTFRCHHVMSDRWATPYAMVYSINHDGLWHANLPVLTLSHG